MLLEEWKATLRLNGARLVDDVDDAIDAHGPWPKPEISEAVIQAFCDRAWALMILAREEGELPDPKGAGLYEKVVEGD